MFHPKQPFLCDSSRQALNDSNFYRDKNSLKHSHINSSRQASRDGSFDQNRSISDSFLEEKCSEPKNTNEKPEADLKQSSSIEHHPNNQVNGMETNTNNEVNSQPQNNNVIEIVNPQKTPSSNYQPIPLPRKGKLNSITKPTYSDNDENNFTPISNSTILSDTDTSVCEIDKIYNVNEDPINTMKSGNLADFNQSEKNDEIIYKNNIPRNRSTHAAIGSLKPDIVLAQNNKSDRDNGLKKSNLQKSNNKVDNEINVTGNTKLKNVDKNKNDVKLKKVDGIENDASLKTTLKKESVPRPKNVDISDKHTKPTDNAQYENLNSKKGDKTSTLTSNTKKKASRKKNNSSYRNTVILKEENEHINSDEEKSVDMPEDGYTTVNKHDNKSDSEDKSLDMDIINKVDKFEKPLLSNGIKSDEKFDNIKFKAWCKEFLDLDKNSETFLLKNPIEQTIVDESKNGCPYINKPLESSILKDNDKDINDIPTKEPSGCNDKNDHDSSNLKIYIFVVVITLSAVGLFVITILILKKKSYEFIF
ncbi:hypothetical protein NBO_584g0001 [Nosema bombycis CQ1]|uniref:Uncharacterized protein n=1 Tax=Nosema bombycis (strain CQ1 / CVCC 102059) TaxID=578461 RepID=R0KMZ9_NOSB1|nr:hypothetical protein NBO_584g0001 [Nosema bombycis CQ1]|eukprot:EOB12026.1 hypothetical protein NBO_584g0001 [Nosema bombycis CQ1]